MQVVILRLDWIADTQSHPKLAALRVQTGYALALTAASGEKGGTILSYQGSAEHDHLVTLAMSNAMLAKETQTLLGLAVAPAGRLLYAADTADKQKKTGQPCRAAISVDFAGQPGRTPQSVVIYPPQPGEREHLERLRMVHIRSGSALLIKASANAQEGEAGPNCRNLLTIGTWEQAIGKDLQVAFVAAPDSEITLKVLSDPREAAGFRGGESELESLELEPLHPARLQVLTAQGNRAQEVRERAGEPFMTVTNLRLGGDFLDFDLSGRVGLPVADFLGSWKWPILAVCDVPLLAWLLRSLRRLRVRAQDGVPPAIQPDAVSAGRKRIFLSYSWGDKERVMQLHDTLEAAGVEPWIDREELRGGADWELSIKRQMRESQQVIVFLSKSSVEKAGYAWAEIRMAVRIAEEQPEGKSYVIPVKLDDCVLPDILSRWNCIELFQPEGERRLLIALGLQP
jgi:hypothetical protein